MKIIKKVLNAILVLFFANLIGFVAFNLDSLVQFFTILSWRMFFVFTVSVLLAGWYLGRTLRK